MEVIECCYRGCGDVLVGLQRKRSFGQEERKRGGFQVEGTEQEKWCPCSSGGYNHSQPGWLIQEMVEDMDLGSIIESLKCYFYYMGC